MEKAGRKRVLSVHWEAKQARCLNSGRKGMDGIIEIRES